MRKILLLVSLLLCASAFASNYGTYFPQVENPVSENGNWLNGATDGTAWGDSKTTKNLIFGTSTTTSCGVGTGNCNDSISLMKGTWTTSQTACAVVGPITLASRNANFYEIEVRLNSAISSNSSTGYEFNYSMHNDGTQYAQLVRWNGAKNDFTGLNAASSPSAIVAGDTLCASNDGSGHLTYQKNGTTLFTWTDTTFSGGAPGIGFFNQGGTTGDNAGFGFTSVTANDGNELWTGIFSATRAENWSNAGIPGGVPSDSWTQCGSTIANGASSATINAALAGCAPYHYVLLGPGAFTISGGLDFAVHSNVELRGSGPNQTFISFSSGASCQGFTANICLSSTDLNYAFSQSNSANWTAGYSVGTTRITLSSVTNLAVGKPLELDQIDDTTDSGDIFVCYQNGTISCSTNGDNGGFLRANRSQMQIVTVTGITGTTVDIYPPIIMPNWNSGNSPQAWWPTSPITNSGVRNLSIDNSNSSSNSGILMFNCLGCWVKGVRSINPVRAHVAAQNSPRTVVQDSYFYHTRSNASVSYGVETDNSSDALVINNIFQQDAEPQPINGNCTGCVYAYNYDVDNSYTSSSWRMAGVLPHAAGDEHILFEGNQGSGLQGDIIHGSHQFQFGFRNFWNGFQKNDGVTTSQNTNPVILNALNRFYSFAGNVFGTAAYHNTYAFNTTGVPSPTAIYVLGASESGGSPTVTVPYDSNVARTMMRYGNYDVVTGATRWCGNSSNTGWVSVCGSTSEVPSGIANFANPIPTKGDTGSGQAAFPASLFLPAKPAWWPAGKPWPPIGPDVSGGNISGVAGHVYSIPAADCYVAMSGPADGTGSVLSFDPTSCYNAQAPPPALIPAPATGLFATVSHLNSLSLEKYNEKIRRFHATFYVVLGTLFSANLEPNGH